MIDQTVLLDPAEPFLFDHQPGGKPLLGTVASLEIMAEACDGMLGKQRITQIEMVEIITPVLFEPGEPRPVTVRCHAETAVSITCHLLSRKGAETTRHLSCRFGLGNRDEAPPRPPVSLSDRPVSAADIYHLFFHGPAFQVVSAAERQEGGLVARMRHPMPAWRRDGSAGKRTEPRLIEFALQTAGLLGLADDGAMMIPRHIAAIQRFSAAGDTAPADLFAVAVPHPSGLTVEVIDARGSLHLRVSGYRTTPLPYPAGPARMQALQEKLRR